MTCGSVALQQYGYCRDVARAHLVEFLSCYHTVLLLLCMELYVHLLQLLLIEIYHAGDLWAAIYTDPSPALAMRYRREPVRAQTTERQGIFADLPTMRLRSTTVGSPLQCSFRLGTSLAQLLP